MDTLNLRKQIRALVEPSVHHLGYDLVAVEWCGGRQGPILRLSIEKPGGVTIRDCSKVSVALSPVLDADDPINAKYVLEVSSPGMERPVERMADFERFAGYNVKLKLVEGHPRRRYTGQLAGVDSDDILVTVDGVVHRIFVDTIERAHLVLSLNEYEELAGATEGLTVLNESGGTDDLK
jgi:ribosome maturation factor RimP